MNSICHFFSSSQSAYYFLNGQIQFIQKNGFEIYILIPNDGFLEQVKELYQGAIIIEVPIKREISLYYDFKALFKVIKIFNDFKFDIIHLHTPKAGLIGALAAKILIHKRVIFHLHGLVSIKYNKLLNGLTLAMERVPLLLSDEVISVSESLKELCINEGLIKKENITTLLNGSINGVDALHKFNPFNTKEQSNQLKNDHGMNNKFVIGFLGRINNDKGLVDIINTLSLLPKLKDEIVLVLVGPIETDFDLNEYVSNKTKIKFLHFPRTENPQIYLSMFDILLFPSHREGFGLVALEANALSIPVVAYDIVGVQNAITHNKTGILVKPGDINGLALAINNYYMNPELRHKHGTEGRKRALEMFKPEVIWKEQLNFYKKLLNE